MNRGIVGQASSLSGGHPARDRVWGWKPQRQAGSLPHYGSWFRGAMRERVRGILFLLLTLATAHGQNLGPRTFRGPLPPPNPGYAPEAASPAVVFIPASQGTNAGLRHEVFLNIPGTTLADLTNHARFPSQPDAVDTVAAFETPSNAADDYGVRVSGFVVPPVNGSYKFYLSANGQAALFLGLDEHPEHKRLIAFEPVGNGPRQWTNGVDQASRGVPATNVSGVIQLVAGQAYYIEVLMKAAAGDDNLAVTWQTPGAAAPANGTSPVVAPALALKPPLSSLPTAGEAVPELAVLDYELLSHMRKWSYKTATLGVMKDGRLVFKRAYGWRDRARTLPMEPDGRMRLASISKTIAAATAKELIAQGRLSADSAVFPLLGLQPYNGILGDARLTNITVSHLLNHQGGWDRNVGGDPILQFFTVSGALGLDHPATGMEFLRYSMSQALHFTPGTRYVYSNLGYIALGRVVDRITGQPFVAVAQRQVLRPWGVRRIQLSRYPEKLREPDEPFYDDDQIDVNVTDFPTAERIRIADGGRAHWEALDSVGALMASVEDLLRFAQGYHLAGGETAQEYASIGEPRGARNGVFTSHSGGWYGTGTDLQERPDGVDWALLSNRNTFNDSEYTEYYERFNRAFASITNWPGDNSTRIELSADSFSVEENEGSLTIGVKRTGESTGSVSVAYSTVAGSAAPGAEFTPVSGTLTFGSNEIARLITIPVLDDANAESPKTFTLILNDPTGGAGLGIASATVTIEDDDNRQPPSVALTAPASGAVFPRGTNVVLTAAPSDSDGTIYTVTFHAGPTLLGEENKPPYTFLWRTPAPGAYSITARTIDNHGLLATSAPVVVTVGAGLAPASPGTIRAEFWHRRPINTLPMLTGYGHFPDAPTGFEYLERFEMSTNRTDYYGTRILGYVLPPASGSYTFWIASDDVAQLWLSADEHPAHKHLIASNSAPVSPGTWTLPGQRSAPVALEAGRRYYIEALHKEAETADHLAVGWQLPDGTLERPIPGLRLAPFAPPTSVRLTETVTIPEGDSGVTEVVLQMRLYSTNSEAVSVSFSTTNLTASPGRDYVETNGTITLGPGPVTESLRLAILSDRFDESNEVFLVGLTLPPDVALLSVPTRVIITDDDPLPSLSINDATVREGDAGPSDAVFSVSLSEPSELLVRVRYTTLNRGAVAGSDFVATNLILNFPPGTTTQPAIVRILDDTLIESNETFVVSLGSVNNATIADNQGVGTILDDDFKLISIAFTGQDARLSFATEPGKTYRIERTDNLTSPIVWEPVPGAEAIAGTGALTEALDPAVVSQAQRFYRVRVN